MRRLLCLVCLLFPISLFAQLEDDFNDGDLTTNPMWTGETDKFIINDEAQLQLQGLEEADIAFLSTPNTELDDTEWQFFVRMAFSPSNNNYAKIYLVSDQADLEGPLNGYYLRIGENGSEDGIDFYRQTGIDSELIYSSKMINASDSPTLKIKVVRDANSNWSFFADPSGGTAFQSLGNTEEATHQATEHFGIVCVHTTGNRDKFYFDDFYIGKEIFDTEIPTALTATIVDEKDLEVQFSEAVTAATAENTNNYTVDNGIGNPATATLDPANTSLVNLSFDQAFDPNVAYTLTVDNITDLAANALSNETLPISTSLVAPLSVLINEIFPKPIEDKGYQEEYIELFNTTDQAINVAGWQYQEGTSNPVAMPSVTIPAKGYAIVCNEDHQTIFEAYGLVIPISKQMGLNNDGDDLIIYDTRNTIINAVSYDDNWYQNSESKEGGIALELIDPEATCATSSNWRDSDDESGGTPGKVNSVLGAYQDTTAPSILRVEIVSNTLITVFFNETLDENTASNENNYMIDQGIGTATSAIVDNESVILSFAQALEANAIYTLTVNGVRDCSENTLENGTITLAIPQTAERFDVVINEIMADPEPIVELPAIEYLELYNKSDKTIDLAGWILKDLTKEIELSSYLLLPDSYVLLVNPEDANILNENVAPTLGVDGLGKGQLNNENDQLSLYNEKGELIFSVFYNDSWYGNDARVKAGGHSLEMKDVNNPCGGIENWGPSKNERGGTPGAVNSNVESVLDERMPDLIRASYLDSSQAIILYFNEPLDKATAVNRANYSIDNGVGTPLFTGFNNNIVFLFLSNPLAAGTIYTVTVSSIKDCVGNPVGLFNTAKVGIPEAIEANDVVINEILANPLPNNFDFIELYNRSNKIIDIGTLEMANADIETPDIIKDFKSVALGVSYQMFPGDFMALTLSPTLLRQQYTTPEEARLLVLSALPTYDDKEGIVILTKSNGERLAEVQYTDDWHYSILDNVDGISLERIDYNAPAQDGNNWHSAATSVRATPGLPNSQSGFASGISEDPIAINPTAFSPDGDGFEDFTFIQYAIDEPGYTMNATIYDSRGRTVKDLVQGELLTSSGNIKWDGSTQDGQKASIGHYIILVEIFNLKGDVQTYKKKCVVAGKL